MTVPAAPEAQDRRGNAARRRLRLPAEIEGQAILFPTAGAHDPGLHRRGYPPTDAGGDHGRRQPREPSDGGNGAGSAHRRKRQLPAPRAPHRARREAEGIVRRGAALTAFTGLVAAFAVAAQPALAAVSITYSVTSGTPGNNGWYLSDVTVSIQTPGATQSTCQTVVTFHSSSDTYQCSASDGTATPSLQLQFKIDKDLPVVTGATADRAPNGNGWYNAPVTVTFTGTDATSGIGSCTKRPTAGPTAAARPSPAPVPTSPGTSAPPSRSTSNMTRRPRP